MIQSFHLGYGSGTTRIDGSSILTGTLNANDAILTGSLTVDTINVSSIRASSIFIPSLITGLNDGTIGTYLDGSSIRTGTVNANRVDVNGIVTVMNGGTVTKIDGGAITCDSVLANKIAVQGLTADAIASGTINTARLDVSGIITVVNAGGTTKISGSGIATNAISATHIGAQQITAGKLESTLVVSNLIKSSDYAENTGVPTAGFKLDSNEDTYKLKVGAGWFGTAIKIGDTTNTFGELSARALTTITASGNNPTTDRAWYRGNNGGTNNGAPTIASSDANPASTPRLLINTLRWQLLAFGGGSVTYLGFQVQPQAASDNLDSMRYIEMEVWRKTSSNTMVKALDYQAIPITDRRYRTATTDSDYWNRARTSWVHMDLNGVEGFAGCASPMVLKCRLVNVVGESAEHWFTCPDTSGTGSTAATGRWTDVGTASPYTGGSSGSGSGGGGDVGGCLPAGSSLLVYGDGGVVSAPIETVKLGSYIIGYDDWDLQAKVSRVKEVFCYQNREIYLVDTPIGQLRCSHDHRLTRHDSRGIAYPPARELKPGDQIYWHNPRTGLAELVEVLSSESTGKFEDVYHISMEAGHVYVGSQFLAHNLKPIDRI